jgi:hypothetical protein
MTIDTRLVVEMSGFVRVSPGASARTMAALFLERGLLLTISGTGSSLSARTSSIAGVVKVTRSIGVKVWKDVLADVMQGDRLEKRLTFDELFVEFTSALGTMTVRVVLAWVAIWVHGWSC